MVLGLSNPMGPAAEMQACIDERENLSVGANLDRQIRQAEEKLARLHAVKRSMEGTGLLSLRISDLQIAMSY